MNVHIYQIHENCVFHCHVYKNYKQMNIIIDHNNTISFLYNSVHAIKLTYGLNFCLLLLFIDISPACHILWNNRDRLSGIKLPDSSAQLLYKKGLITRERSRGMSSSGYFLSRNDLTGIYAAVVNDHNKLRDFAEILLLSYDTGSLAIDLLKEYCKHRV